jgi:hypothetical protein
MTQDFGKEHVLAVLREKLPPIFTRKHVEKLTGGLLNSGNLKRLDVLGQGPKAFKVGQLVGYEKDSFLEWLEQRVGPRGDQKQ